MSTMGRTLFWKDLWLGDSSLINPTLKEINMENSCKPVMACCWQHGGMELGSFEGHASYRNYVKIGEYFDRV